MTSAFDDPERFMMELHPAAEVAARCIILCCVAAHSEDTSLMFDGWLKTEGLWPGVSRNEAIFLLDPKPPERGLIGASWRKESFVMLMWCLGKIDSLPPPVQIDDSSAILDLVPSPDQSTAAFREDAVLRPFDEIVSVYEEVYDAHWRLRDAKINGRPLPEGLEKGVIYERHYALNWLRRYGVDEEQGWDEITTDT